MGVSGIFAAEKFFQKKVIKKFFEIEFVRVFTYALYDINSKIKSYFELRIKTKFFIFRKIEFLLSRLRLIIFQQNMSLNRLKRIIYITKKRV